MAYIGIDIGTFCTYIGYLDKDGKPKILDDGRGNYTPNLGRLFNEVTAKTPAEIGKSRFDVQGIMMNIKDYLRVDNSYVSAETGVKRSSLEIFTYILTEIRRFAQARLGSIDGAVITVPAHYNQRGREDMLRAAKKAGIKVLCLLQEPDAAVIAYSRLRDKNMHRTLLVYDLGAGSFECSVVKADFRQDEFNVETLAWSGNKYLGGVKWTDEIETYFVNEFCNRTGADINGVYNDPENAIFFAEGSDKLKKILSVIHTATAELSCKGHKEIIHLTRGKFDSLTEEMLFYTFGIVDRMLLRNKISLLNDIDGILLSGGATRMPQVTQRLIKEYGLHVLSCNPEKASALGAAVVANSYGK